MKIAMLIEYYWPFDRGGSEWSTHDLAVLLSKKGQEVIIITLNYGAKETEVNDGLKIVRFPFYRKLKEKAKFLTPFWTNNIFWFFYSAYQIYKTCKKENVDVLHVQSRNLIFGGYLASRFLRKPFVATFRDYQVLCNLGFCLLGKTKRCDLAEYLTREIPFYLKTYPSKLYKLLVPFYFLMFIRARLMDIIVRTIVRQVPIKVCVSRRQCRIFKDNGFENVVVIYSSVIFPKNPSSIKKRNQVIFIGKLSFAKGVELFVKSIPKIIPNVNEKLTFKIIGGGHLKEKLGLLVKKLGFSDIVEFSSHQDHQRVLSEIAESRIVVLPSVWEEPFGRVVAEAFSQETPVVTSKKGAFVEIIDNGKTGILADLTVDDLAKAVVTMFNNYSKFQKNLSEKWPELKEKFEEEPVNQYLEIYKEVLK